jgi:hypothetical protein
MDLTVPPADKHHVHVGVGVRVDVGVLATTDYHRLAPDQQENLPLLDPLQPYRHVRPLRISQA